MSTTSEISETRLDAPIANIFLLLGRAFQSPDGFSPEEPRLLREALDACSLDLTESGLSIAYQWEKALEGERTPLLLDYARLFLGPFEIQAAPYASLYLDPERRLMGQISQEVAQAYAEAGLAPPEGQPSDAPDHIVSECEFLYFLAHQRLSTGDPVWEKRLRDFLNGHFACWVPAFADAMLMSEQRHPFYRSVAVFSTAFTREATRALSRDGPSGTQR